MGTGTAATPRGARSQTPRLIASCRTQPLHPSRPIPLTFCPCPRGAAAAAPCPRLGARAAFASCSCVSSPGLDGDAVNEGWDLLVLVHPARAQKKQRERKNAAPTPITGTAPARVLLEGSAASARVLGLPSWGPHFVPPRSPVREVVPVEIVVQVTVTAVGGDRGQQVTSRGTAGQGQPPTACPHPRERGSGFGAG